MPACAPVRDTALLPSPLMAIAVSAMVVCSPVASSTSISRSAGSGETARAILMRLSVTPDIAGNDRDDAIARGLCFDDPLCDIEDAVRGADGRSAIFLYDKAHRGLRMGDVGLLTGGGRVTAGAAITGGPRSIS